MDLLIVKLNIKIQKKFVFLNARETYDNRLSIVLVLSIEHCYSLLNSLLNIIVSYLSIINFMLSSKEYFSRSLYYSVRH
jgi:hypothetical protein